MVVNNITKITGEEAYNRLYKTSKKNYIYKLVLLSIFSLVGIPILVLGIVLKNETTIFLGALIVAVTIAYVIYSIVGIKRLPKAIKKANEDIINNGAIYNYKFKENSVDINLEVGTKKRKLTYQYTSLKGAEEYEDYYNLHFNDSDMLYVFKNGFENERMEEFFKTNLKKGNKKLKIKDMKLKE